MADDKPDAPVPAEEPDLVAEATSSEAAVAEGSAGPSSVASSSTTPLGPDGQPLSKKAQKRMAKRVSQRLTESPQLTTGLLRSNTS